MFTCLNPVNVSCCRCTFVNCANVARAVFSSSLLAVKFINHIVRWYVECHWRIICHDLKKKECRYFAASLLYPSQHLLVVYLSPGTLPVAHSPWLGLLSASDFKHNQSNAMKAVWWAKSVHFAHRQTDSMPWIVITKFSDTQCRQSRLCVAGFVSRSGYSWPIGPN